MRGEESEEEVGIEIGDEVTNGTEIGIGIAIGEEAEMDTAVKIYANFSLLTGKLCLPCRMGCYRSSLAGRDTIIATGCIIEGQTQDMWSLPLRKDITIKIITVGPAPLGRGWPPKKINRSKFTYEVKPRSFRKLGRL